MALIKSISGIRGTIGGKSGEGLGGVDIVKFTAAYAEFIRRGNPSAKTIAVGRDARLSGKDGGASCGRGLDGHGL